MLYYNFHNGIDFGAVFKREHEPLLPSPDQGYISEPGPADPGDQAQLKRDQEHHKLESERVRHDLEVI